MTDNPNTEVENRLTGFTPEQKSGSSLFNAMAEKRTEEAEINAAENQEEAPTTSLMNAINYANAKWRGFEKGKVTKQELFDTLYVQQEKIFNLPISDQERSRLGEKYREDLDKAGLKIDLPEIAAD